MLLSYQKKFDTLNDTYFEGKQWRPILLISKFNNVPSVFLESSKKSEKKKLPLNVSLQIKFT